MSNIVKQFLKFDKKDIKKPSKTITLALNKLDGNKFEFPLVAVDAERLTELQEETFSYENEKIKVQNTYHVKAMTIIEGCPSIFKSDEVLEHFDAASPLRLVKLLLESGEMDVMQNEINGLSGFNKTKTAKEEKEEVKN